MRLKSFIHTIGWSVAFLLITLAFLCAVWVTIERLSSFGRKGEGEVVFPTLDKRIPSVPKPQPLPPDYAIFVLCYHDFREKPSKWSITPQRLEAHIQTLKALGFTFLTLGEAVKLLTGQWKGNPPKRAVVITVDDGFRSAYSVLFPLLKRYGVKATLFVYTDWIDKNLGALTWEQLREMAQSGLVEIASHTVTHAYPRKLKRKLNGEQYKRKMEWEFVKSKAELEQRLGIKVEGLAYPGGYADGTLKGLAQRTGYKWAAVINPKPLTVGFDRYAIPRYGVSAETTVEALKAWVIRQPATLIRYGDKVNPKRHIVEIKASKRLSISQARKYKIWANGLTFTASRPEGD